MDLKGKGREIHPDLDNYVPPLREPGPSNQGIASNTAPVITTLYNTVADWKIATLDKFHSYSNTASKMAKTFKDASNEAYNSPTSSVSSKTSDPALFLDNTTTVNETVSTAEKPKVIELVKSSPVPDVSPDVQTISNQVTPKGPIAPLPSTITPNVQDIELVAGNVMTTFSEMKIALISSYSRLAENGDIAKVINMKIITNKLDMLLQPPKARDDVNSYTAMKKYESILSNLQRDFDDENSQALFNFLYKELTEDLEIVGRFAPLLIRQKEGNSHQTRIVNTIHEEMGYLLHTDKDNEFYSKAITKWNTRYNIPTIDKESLFLLNAIDVLLHDTHQGSRLNIQRSTLAYLYRLLDDIKDDNRLYNFYNYHLQHITYEFISNHMISIKQLNSQHTKKILFIYEVRPKKFPLSIKIIT